LERHNRIADETQRSRKNSEVSLTKEGKETTGGTNLKKRVEKGRKNLLKWGTRGGFSYVWKTKEVEGTEIGGREI